MKILFPILALILIGIVGPKLAFSADRCIFGQETSQLDELMDAGVFQKGFTKVPGKHHFGELEMNMVYSATYGDENCEETLEKAFEEFSRADGAIQYFSRPSNGKRYAVVTSYPGDNEYGIIVEIKESRSGKKYYTIKARVNDGFLEDCGE